MNTATSMLQKLVPIALACTGVFGLNSSANALTIVPVFGVGVSSAAQTAFNYAAAEFQAAFTDAVTLNIAVNAGSTGLGGSSTPLMFVVPATYGQVRSALIADQLAHPSADGAVSIGIGGSINSTTDPTGGMVMLYTNAQAKALGALAANNSALDGTFTYNASLSYTFDPANRGTGGFDFIGVAEHEISEIMGRITLNGGSFSGSPNADPFDLFNFSGAGVHTLGQGAGRYFSINNGTTSLRGYNNATSNGGDPQDFDGLLATDPFNAFTGSNQAHSLNAVDLATLDVIGWDLAEPAPVPEPSSWALMLAGLAAAGTWARRRTSRA